MGSRQGRGRLSIWGLFGISAVFASACSPTIMRLPNEALTSEEMRISSLAISPTTKTLAAGNSFTFVGSGGVPPYTYSVVSVGGGSVDPATGAYTSPVTPGVYTIRITDHAGGTSDATATVNPAVTISPLSLTAVIGSNYPYPIQGQGGVPSYDYSMLSGSGSVDPSSGMYTTPASPGLSTVKVTDSIGNSANAIINNIRFRTNGAVKAAVTDGTSWYIGGQFSAVNPLNAPRIIALDLTGNPLPTCDLKTGFDSGITAIVKSGSSIYVGGYFTRYQGQPANYLAKLDATTCALDTNFSPPDSNGFDGAVHAIAVNGTSLYLGGAFTAYKGIANSANYLAKLDLASGEIDTGFSPAGATANGFDNSVTSLAIAGSSLYVGGTFTAYKGVVNSANRLAKLQLATGELDAAFSPAGATANGFNNFVKALAIEGTSLFAVGYFTDYKGVANSANHLAKLDLATGTIDTVFSPVGLIANGFDANVESLAVKDGSLYIGGYFNSYKGVENSANYLAKIDAATGAIDSAFSPIGASANGTNGAVYDIAANNEWLYVVGFFSAYKGTTANNIAKIHLITGTMDTTFGPTGSSLNGFNELVSAVAASDTALYLGGDFSGYGGQSANNIAKFDATTWEFDSDFSPPSSNGFSSMVTALVISGTSLYVGGYFSAYKGVANSANGLAKLDLATGAIDTTFSPVGASANGFNANVRALAVSADSLYVGGMFDSYKGVANSANRLAKLDLVTGTIDTVFSPIGANANGFSGVANTVNALAVSGTSLYVGGKFSAYRGVANSANKLAMLNLTTGAIDTTFSPVGANGFDWEVYALAVDNTSLFVGGLFSSYKGVMGSAMNLAKLNLSTGAIDTTFSPVGANGFDSAVETLAVNDGSLYVGGWFSTYRGIDSSINLAKLDTSTGDIDTSFNPASADPFDNSVSVLVVSGSSLWAGGDFNSFLGNAANKFVPLSLDAGLLQE